MKQLILVAVLMLIVALAGYGQTNSSSRYQRGYVRKSTGTYVQPHYKTNPNGTNKDNYSTKSNTNTYTGANGTRAADHSSEAYNYGRGKSVQTGNKGGQYYSNSNGKKVYVPKR